MWPLYIILALLTAVGMTVLGAVYLKDIVRLLLGDDAESDARLPTQDFKARAPKGIARDAAFKRGDDLRSYPHRLEQLENSLEDSHKAAQEQLNHLRAKEVELRDKGGRDDLVERYHQDVTVLDNRAATTRRVLATVWKTRAILHLRVHLAVAARQRPDLTHLPAPLDVKPGALDSASLQYGRASDEVRRFVETLDLARSELAAVIPECSSRAEVQDSHLEAIEFERVSVDETFDGLRERMDQLADSLDYLSNRFRTQSVVEGAALGVDIGPEAGRLLDEVSGALSQLESLSAVGDKGLADAAVTNLAEDISQLERAGMEADAEAEASLEVERLLQQFKRKTAT